jgi:hypothetical protein
MKVAPFAIQSFASFLLGAQIFERIKGVVIRQEDKTLTGEEKRKAALDELSFLGIDIAKWMVNLAIELAVAYLRKLAA